MDNPLLGKPILPFAGEAHSARIVVQRRRAAAAVENIPLQTDHHSGTRRKVIGFAPER
jgi:hypothetical protein